MRIPIESSFTWIKPDGRPSDYFLELIQDISRKTFTENVSVTAPTNGQAMVYDSTTKLWTPGAN